MKKETKQNVTKKLRVANLSSGQTNGLNSSLVFTPVQVSGVSGVLGSVCWQGKEGALKACSGLK